MRRKSLLVLVLASTAAHAEPTKSDLLFDEGKKLEADGKWAEACQKFEASSQLDPEAPGTLLNLGLCNEKLGGAAIVLEGINVTIGLVERNRYNGTTDITVRNDADDKVRLWSTTTFAAGLVAGGLAIYFYVTAPKAETYEAVLPVITTDQVG